MAALARNQHETRLVRGIQRKQETWQGTGGRPRSVPIHHRESGMPCCCGHVVLCVSVYSEAQSRGSREVSADRRECDVQLQLQLQQLMMYLVKYETVNRPS